MISENDTPITMVYRNYRGEIAVRKIIPTKLWFGSTEYHQTEQYILSAYDLSKGVYRDFALKDCIFIG